MSETLHDAADGALWRGYFCRRMDFKSFHKLRPNPLHVQMINNGMHI